MLRFACRLVPALFVLMYMSFPASAVDLRSKADSIRQQYRIPELGYAALTADSVLLLQVTGVHKAGSLQAADQARPSDYFHLGSNTKAITGFIAAWLVEQGKIDWTARFFDLFPDWKQGSDTAFYDITLQQLLSHRARIQAYTSGLEFKVLPAFNGTVSEKRTAFVKYVLTRPPVARDSEAYHYSNAGYSVAAQMLEKASGRTWEQLVEEVLGHQLHLHYKIGWPNLHDPGQPWGHWIENDSLKALPPDYDYNLALAEPAGDISMPLADYAAFIRLNIQGLKGQNNLLRADTYRFLHTGFADYSIGWGNVIRGPKQFSEHAGSAGTFFCYTVIDRVKGIGYIVIANSGTEEAQNGIFTLIKQMAASVGNPGGK